MVWLGSNTPDQIPPAPYHHLFLRFHDRRARPSAAYMNGTGLVGVSKAGSEEGVPMIAGTQIIAPSCQTMAQAATQGDELVIDRCDLDLCHSYKAGVFNFTRHREPASYRLIVEKIGRAHV